MLLFSTLAALVAGTNSDIFNDGACTADDDNKVGLWGDDDEVELYLGEQLINDNAMLESLGFRTTHMGVFFHNRWKKKWLGFDFGASEFSSVAGLILPMLKYEWNDLPLWKQIWKYLNGEAVEYLQWNHHASVRIDDDKPTEFRNLDLAGVTNGANAKAIRKWVTEEYTRQDERPFTFDLYTIYDGATNERLRKSRTCHDFVEDVLMRVNFTDGKKHISVFKDTFNFNTSRFEEIEFSLAKSRRDFMRFLRMLRKRVHHATADLPSMLNMFAIFSYYDLPYIILIDGDKYMRVSFTKEHIANYCRMPLDITVGEPINPPKYSDLRVTCRFERYDVNTLLKKTRLSLSEWFILIEQSIDDFLFGRDGKGGVARYWEAIFASTAAVILCSKLVKHFTLK